MKTLACFGNPISVIQLAPTSGVFGSSALVGDKEGFVQKVLSKWYCNPGNTVPVESMRHIEMVEQLYDFYLKYRDLSEKSSRNLGPVLHTLYRTGSIKEAEAVLYVKTERKR